MKRRSFIKTVCGSVIAFPFISLASTIPEPKQIVPGSVEDLFQFVESKKIWTPHDGLVPFKLYPFQKAILRTMYYNDKVVMVKGRQIGMSYLLAGFAAWYSRQKPTIVHYRGHRYACIKDWNDNRFIPFDPWIPSRAINPRRLGILDETNFNYLWNGIMNRGVHLDKVIVTGTPDPAGNLRRFCDDHTRDFHQVWIPCQSCEPLFTKERIAEAKRNLSTKMYKMEIEGNLWYA